MVESDFTVNPELAHSRVVWRVDALDKWREKRVEPELVLLRKELQGLVKADEVAHEVALLLDTRRTVRLGFVGWTVALAAGIATVGSFVTSVWVALHLGLAP